MNAGRRELVAALAPGVLLAAMALLGVGLFVATLDPAERAAFAAMLAPRGALVLFGGLVLAGALGLLAHRAYRRWVVGPARLVERARVLLTAGSPEGAEAPAVPIEADPGSPETEALARLLRELADQRDALRVEMQARVAEASHAIELERNRLAALMAELTQSVVVCNLDGRILLYNHRARQQFQALSSAGAVTRGGELIGLGRSIYAVFDRPLVAHALERIEERLRLGDANPSAQFVTGTQGGQLLRVQMAPVREIGSAPIEGRTAAAPDAFALNGFVLMLDDITRAFAVESERDRLLHELVEGSRASLGALSAAVDMLEFPDLDAPSRQRFQGVVRDEVRALSERIRAAAARSTEAWKTRWPLEDMLGADLVATVARRIESEHGCAVSTGEVDRSLWLQVDSYSLVQVLVAVAGRLVDAYGVGLVGLRLAPAGARARLDMVWTGSSMSTETAVSWETEPIRIGDATVAMTIREVVERHDGAFWFERERVRHETFFRFLLPLAEAEGPRDPTPRPYPDSRPEFYDFDLFRRTEPTRDLAARRLDELTYTVFDTETTGLDPSGGDEIIQIGALRIVGGKLRRQETFEQLVDPRRSISPESIPIHGIRPEMVAGQPTIDIVLPAFHAFARETVLVAHNAAFDMRFLQLKEAATGIVFDQPVLDTLLLSSLIHPQQSSHRLEAISERLGVAVLGRHSALGDALTTAEVFVKMIPLLAERGIHTLGEALDAARRTYHAKVTY